MTLKYMSIPAVETIDWLRDDPRIIEHLTQAYSECIPSILKPLTLDQRFLVNHHRVNLDFADNPMFILGIHKLSHFVLAILYVFPQFRRQGLARRLIWTFQQQLNDVIQVAVDARNADLRKLYNQSDFRTLGNESTDLLGFSYIDYFWSPVPFRLEPAVGGTLVYLE